MVGPKVDVINPRIYDETFAIVLTAEMFDNTETERVKQRDTDEMFTIV